MDYIIASMDDDCAKVPLAIHIARLQGTYTVFRDQCVPPGILFGVACALVSDSTMSLQLFSTHKATDMPEVSAIPDMVACSLQVVGLGPSVWIIVVIFVLLAGVIGELVRQAPCKMQSRGLRSF